MAIGRRKIVYGAGINDADYQVYRCRRVDGKMVVDWVCPYYSRWLDMIRRCYSKKQKTKQKNYEQCTTSEEWKTFSNFKKWMEKQDWEGKHLDKDLKKPGNFVYSAETCLFIDPLINNLIIEKVKNGLPRGVSKTSKTMNTLYRARIIKKYPDGTRKECLLGTGDSPYILHEKWIRAKKDNIDEILEAVSDPYSVYLAKRWFNRLIEESELNYNLSLEDLKYAT